MPKVETEGTAAISRLLITSKYHISSVGKKEASENIYISCKASSWIDTTKSKGTQQVPVIKRWSGRI
uniref:Uncharacterized protein n=1 Tax=Arundo donax TaxID=35708 RepID=A0A0A9BYF5_ARUDO